MAHLVLITGEEKKTFKLTKKVTYIGRKSSCDISLDDSNVSRHHARIINDANDYLLVDTQSRNGTFVNGQKILQTFLSHDDHIRIGTNEFRFYLDPEDRKPSFQLSKYEILEKIGRGGMGIVYKARQKSMDRIVAIKVLHERFTNDSAFVDRFIREAQAAGKLSHPNIIHVHDVGKEKGLYYFSMEYISGSTVTSLLMEKGFFPADEALDIVKQVAKALDYAHKNNIIHRDIKPDNIMITEGGEVKLADLGIARNLKESTSDVEKSTVYGTPLYMSPEQALGMDLDGRTDIYSLGATAYHMVTGRVPFKAEKAVDVLKKHINEPLIPPDAVNPAVPEQVSRLIQIMMAKDPEERFQSAMEVVEEIKHIQKGGNLAHARTSLGETAILRRLSLGEEMEPSVDVIDPAADARARHLARLDPRQRKNTVLLVAFVLGVVGVFLATIYLSETFKRYFSPRSETADVEALLAQARRLRAEGKLYDEYLLLADGYPRIPLTDARRVQVKKRFQTLEAFVRREDWRTVLGNLLDSYTAFIQFTASHPDEVSEIISRGEKVLTGEFTALLPEKAEKVRSILEAHKKKREEKQREEEERLFAVIMSVDTADGRGAKTIKELAADYLRDCEGVNPAHAEKVRRRLRNAQEEERNLILRERRRQIDELDARMKDAFTNRRYSHIREVYEEFTRLAEIKNTRWEMEARKIFSRWEAALRGEFATQQNDVNSYLRKKNYRTALALAEKAKKEFAGTSFEKKAAALYADVSARIRGEYTSLLKAVTEDRLGFRYHEARMKILKAGPSYIGTPYQERLDRLSDDLERLKKLWDYLLAKGEKIHVPLPVTIVKADDANILEGIKPQGVYLKITRDEAVPANFVQWNRLSASQTYVIFKSILLHTSAPAEYFRYLAVFCTYRNIPAEGKEALELHRKRLEEEKKEESGSA